MHVFASSSISPTYQSHRNRLCLSAIIYSTGCRNQKISRNLGINIFLMTLLNAYKFYSSFGGQGHVATKLYP
jgi:hypothetical protein